MNKSFKVLWNRFRNSYVVASEATASQGKAGKAAKTVLTAAVVGAMALGGVAAAKTIDNGSFGTGEGQYDSTKFISGNGESLVIKTDGDVTKLISAIKNREETGINGILEALGTPEGTVTLVGVSGGQNFIDGGTQGVFTNSLVNTALDLVGKEFGIENLGDKLEKTVNKLDLAEESVTLTGDTNILIGTNPAGGEEQTNPFLIGTVAGDRLVGAGMSGTISMFGSEHPLGEGGVTSIEIKRTGNTKVTMLSGNSLLMFGGSSAINVGGFGGSASFLNGLLGGTINFTSESTKTVLDGSTYMAIKGSSSVAGLFGGGSAIALGGTAISEVLGNSHIVIDTETNSEGYEGGSVGVVGGGFAAGVLGGEAQSSVAGTQIDLNGGLVVGTIGGGAAVSGEISPVVDSLLDGALLQIKDNLVLTGSLEQGGSAITTSGNIVINVGAEASSYGLVGGGLAAAQSMYDSEKGSTSKVVADEVTINIGNDDVKEPVFGDSTEKGDFFEGLKEVKDELQRYLEDHESVGEYALIKHAIEKLNKPGVTVGTLGGGMALAYQANNGASDFQTTSKAESYVSKVGINVKSGYNVGIFGSGLAAGSAASIGEDTLNAVSTVGSSAITLSGGETIGVMGGGISYFTGTREPNTGIGAQATTGTVTIGVTGDASVDGVVGGGLAIDDTNPLGADGNPVTTKNAYSEVGTVTIVADSGTINKLSFSAFAGQENKKPNNINATRPEFRDHVDALAYAMEKQSAAIVGGGLASGMRDENAETGGAHVGEVNIILGHTSEEVQEGVEGDIIVGDEVNRANIFGGGIAANGAHSSVGTVNITVRGNAVINGDIYAGGIAQDGDYQGNPEYYEKSLSTVENATITILGGTVKGDIYAGGVVSSAGNTQDKLSEATVGSATIILGNADAFQGQLIDGTGADEANLTFAIPEYAFKDGQTVKGFDTITAGRKVSGLKYDFGEGEEAKTSTKVFGGIVEFTSLAHADGKELGIGDAETVGAAAINLADGETLSGLTMKVDNGFLALNSDAETAQKAISSAPSQAKAAAYVTGTVDLTNNKLLVGSDVSEANNGLYVGSSGMLVADAAGKTNVSGSTNFADGSSIHFVNVDKGETVTIGSDGQEATVGTTVDNVLFKVAQNGNQYSFTQREDGEMGEVGLGDSDLGFLSDLKNHDNPGADFISDFLDQSNTGVNNGNRGQQINAAMNLATAAGVQTAAIDGTMMGIEAANKRASIINNFVNGGVLFAEVSGKHSEVGGGSGFGEIEYDLGGLVVGGEYTTNDWTFGALANLGTGSVDGKGDNSKVENDVDYYGLQAYVGKRFGQFNLVGQVGYLMSENDISHNMIGSNTADVDADVWTIGVRGEVRFDVTENSRVVPYVGVNYLRVSTDGYRTSQGVKVDDIDQNLWTTPIGVKYAGDLKTASGWVWTPSVDVAYIPAFGDDEVDATTDVGAIGHTTMDVWSNSVGRMKLGITANKGNFGFGLEAGAAAGSDDLTEYFGQLRVDYRF